MDLDGVLTVRADRDGFAIDVPDGWQQGKGAFGGLAFGWLTRALLAAEPDPGRDLRALSVQLIGPLLPGPARITLDRLRDGASVSHVAARLVQGDQTLAMAMGTLGSGRAEVDYATRSAPTAPRWDELPSVPRGPIMPAFSSHFEYRFCLGGAPWSGAAEAYSGAWVRPDDPGGRRDPGVIACLLDCLWPAVLVRMRENRPMATIAAFLQLLEHGGDAAEPALITVRSDFAADGFTIEDRELWSADGRLLGTCRQSMAVLG